ncbi:MAG: type II toxin-antitoxin system RelE/ParE family toxin [Candidatus Rokubacteria bacterium]|nr:type II toxin-antitoxin system RelE/ParE family toxin [Candidatus Rokubacteria bacterium]
MVVDAKVTLLQRLGPRLGRPHSDVIIQHAGKPYRVLYAFEPRRVAILLIGGEKTGDKRWYEKFLPVADRLYDEHIATLKREGLI